MKARTAWISAMARLPASALAALPGRRRDGLERGKDLVGIELEEALLVLADLVHADVVVAGLRVLADGGEVRSGSGPQVIDSATCSSVTSSATASKCAGSGSSQERLLSIAEVGQCSRAMRRAVASSFAQQTVSSP